MILAHRVIPAYSVIRVCMHAVHNFVCVCVCVYSNRTHIAIVCVNRSSKLFASYAAAAGCTERKEVCEMLLLELILYYVSLELLSFSQCMFKHDRLIRDVL